jgi:glycosyltransferase involved in cell wall biosynthesis
MRDRFYSRFLAEREPIRALYVVPSAGFGGVERQVSWVLPQLSAWGVEVFAVVGPGSRLVTWLEEGGVRGILHTQALPTPDPDRRGWKGAFQATGVCRRALGVREEIERLIHERRIDVVVAATPVGWLAASEPAERYEIPLVWWAVDAPTVGEQTVVRALAAFHRPNLLLCASEGLEQTWGPVVRAPAEVVRGAVDLNRFRRGRGEQTAFAGGGGGPTVGFAGRLLAEKHFGDYVAVAQRVGARRPDARFLVAGDGAERAACEAWARAAGLGDRMHFLGYVEDMRAFYAACDVLVDPSAQARPSQTVLEAIAMMCPVVTTNAVGAGGVLAPEAAAELAVPVGDVEAMASVVDRLLASPDRCARLLGHAHDRVRREFDAQRAARRTARLLHTLVMWSGGTSARATVPINGRRLELAT